MFTIKEVKKSDSSEIIVENNSTQEFLSIIPEYGGRLKELCLRNGNKNISIIKVVDRIDSQNRDDIFTNAKLSPFAGRIKDGQYFINNKKYNLKLNYPEEGNACHGFVYDKQFSVKDKIINDEFALCSLQYFYEGKNAGYPFKYSIELIYKLTAFDGIIFTTKIKNRSGVAIPLSDGWHHYFDLSVPVDELKLKLDVSEIMELNERNIPTGVKESYNNFSSPQKLGNTRFDSCFKINGKNGKAVTELISTGQNINMKIWQETGLNKYNYLVVYTPPNRKTIAIEPITSNINSFNNGKGLILLEPEKEFVSSFGIVINKND